MDQFTDPECLIAYNSLKTQSSRVSLSSAQAIKNYEVLSVFSIVDTTWKQLQFNNSDFYKISKDVEYLIKSDYLQSVFFPNPSVYYDLLVTLKTQKYIAIDKYFLYLTDPKVDESLRIILFQLFKSMRIENKTIYYLYQQVIERIKPQKFKSSSEYERELIPTIQLTLLLFQLISPLEQQQMLFGIESILGNVDRNVLKAFYCSALSYFIRFQSNAQTSRFVLQKLSTFLSWLNKPKHAGTVLHLLAEVSIIDVHFKQQKDFDKIMAVFQQQQCKSLLPLIRMASHFCFGNNILDPDNKDLVLKPPTDIKDEKFILLLFDILNQMNIQWEIIYESLCAQFYVFFFQEFQQDIVMSQQYIDFLYFYLQPFISMQENTTQFYLEDYNLLLLLVKQNTNYFLNKLCSFSSDLKLLFSALIISADMSKLDQVVQCLTSNTYVFLLQQQNANQLFFSIFKNPYSTSFVSSVIQNQQCLIQFQNFNKFLFNQFLSYLNSFADNQQGLGYTLYYQVIVRVQQFICENNINSSYGVYSPMQMLKMLVINLGLKLEQSIQDQALSIVEKLLVQLYCINYYYSAGEELSLLIKETILYLAQHTKSTIFQQIMLNVDNHQLVLSQLFQKSQTIANQLFIQAQSLQNTSVNEKIYLGCQRNVLHTLIFSSQVITDSNILQQYLIMLHSIFSNCLQITKNDLDFLENLFDFQDQQHTIPCWQSYEILASVSCLSKLNSDYKPQQIDYSYDKKFENTVNLIISFAINQNLLKKCLNLGFVSIVSKSLCDKFPDIRQSHQQSDVSPYEYQVSSYYFEKLLGSKSFVFLIYILVNLPLDQSNFYVMQFVLLTIIKILNEIPSVQQLYLNILTKFKNENQYVDAAQYEQIQSFQQLNKLKEQQLFDDKNIKLRIQYSMSYINSQEFQTKFSEIISNLQHTKSQFQHSFFSKIQVSLYIFSNIYDHNSSVLRFLSEFDFSVLQQLLLQYNIIASDSLKIFGYDYDYSHIIIRSLLLFGQLYNNAFERKISINTIIDFIVTKFCQIRSEDYQFITNIFLLYLQNLREYDQFSTFLRIILESDEFQLHSRKSFGIQYEQGTKATQQQKQQAVQEILYCLKILSVRALVTALSINEKPLLCLQKSDHSITANGNLLFCMDDEDYDDSIVSVQLYLRDIHILISLASQQNKINIVYFSQMINKHNFGSRIRMAFKQGLSDEASCCYFYITAIVMFCVIIHGNDQFRSESSKLIMLLQDSSSFHPYWTNYFRQVLQNDGQSFTVEQLNKTNQIEYFDTPLLVPGYLWFLQSLKSTKSQNLFQFYQHFAYTACTQFIERHLIVDTPNTRFLPIYKKNALSRNTVEVQNYDENSQSQQYSNMNQDSTLTHEYSLTYDDKSFRNYHFGDFFIHSFLKFLTTIGMNQTNQPYVNKYSKLLTCFVTKSENQVNDGIPEYQNQQNQQTKKFVVKLVQFYSSSSNFQLEFEIQQFQERKVTPKFIKVAEKTKTKEKRMVSKNKALSSRSTEIRTVELTPNSNKILSIPIDEFWNANFNLNIINEIFVHLCGIENLALIVFDTLNMYHSDVPLYQANQRIVCFRDKIPELPQGLASRNIQAFLLQKYLNIHLITGNNVQAISETIAHLLSNGIYCNLFARYKENENSTIALISQDQHTTINSGNGTSSVSFLQNTEIQQLQLVDMLDSLEQFHFLKIIFNNKDNFSINNFIGYLLEKQTEMKLCPSELLYQLLICFISNCIMYSNPLTTFDDPPWKNSKYLDQYDSELSSIPQFDLPVVKSPQFFVVLQQKNIILDSIHQLILFSIQRVKEKQFQLQSKQLYAIVKAINNLMNNIIFQYNYSQHQQLRQILEQILDLFSISIQFYYVSIHQIKIVTDNFDKIIEKLLLNYFSNTLTQLVSSDLLKNLLFKFCSENLILRLFGKLSPIQIVIINTKFVTQRKLTPIFVDFASTKKQIYQQRFDKLDEKANQCIADLQRTNGQLPKINAKEKQQYYMQHVINLLQMTRLDDYVSAQKLIQHYQQFPNCEPVIDIHLQIDLELQPNLIFILNILVIIQILLSRLCHISFVKEMLQENRGIIIQTINYKHNSQHLIKIIDYYNSLIKQESMFDQQISIDIQKLFQLTDLDIHISVIEILIIFIVYRPSYRVSACITLLYLVLLIKNRQLQKNIPSLGILMKKRNDFDELTALILNRIFDAVNIVINNKDDLPIESSLDMVQEKADIIFGE